MLIRFNSSWVLEINIKDLSGLSKAFDTVYHKVIKKLLTWSAIIDCKLQTKEDYKIDFQHDKMFSLVALGVSEEKREVAKQTNKTNIILWKE